MTLSLTLGLWMIPPAGLSIAALAATYIMDGKDHAPKDVRATAWIIAIAIWVCTLYGRWTA